MKKRLLGLLICLSMVLFIFPQIVLAENTQDSGTEAECACKTKCTEDRVNIACPICGGRGANLELCKGTRNDEAIEQKNILTVSSYSDGIVAKVGNDAFFSLSDAVAAVISTDDKTGTVQIVEDIELSEFIIIPNGANIKLVDDGVAHTITMVSNKDQYSYAAFVIEQGGALSIDGANLTFTRQAYNERVSGLIACHGAFTLEDGTFDLNGQNLAWNTNTNSASAIIHVCGANAIFTMNGGTIQNASLSTNTGGIQVSSYAKFILNNGVIKNITGGNNARSGAVLVYAPDTSYNYGKGTAYFEMNGGIIKDNTGYRGAGVHVVGQSYNFRATMLLNNGTIQGNTCNSNVSQLAGGGGVYIEGNAEVTMEGGKILDNTAVNGVGGGICTIDGYTTNFPDPNAPNAWAIETYSRYYPAAFTMLGGTISGNQAKTSGTSQTIIGDGGCGGGVYIASNCVTLKGGYIENNTAQRQGGGVYVGSIPYKLTIYNAVVTGNEASVLGGGVWACPTGDTEVFVTNGAGVYGNKSDGAGDDIASVKVHGKNYGLTLADRILGSGQVLWYKDGGIADNENNLGNPDDSPRYNSSGDAKPITQIQNNIDPYALKAVVSNNAKELAQNSAALFIRGNKSARGGGIGTNGGIVMGEKDNEYTLKVTKDWGDTDESLKTPVTVSLKVGDTVLDSVTLNAENGWTAEFTQLPDPATLSEEFFYGVVENPVPENFEAAYSDAIMDEATRIIAVKVTNTQIIEKDPTGDPPLEQPSEPPKDITGGNQTGNTNSSQTGDNSNLALWIAVMLAAGAGLIGTALYSRKKYGSNS